MIDPLVAAVAEQPYLMGGFELMTADQYGIPVSWVIFVGGEFKLIGLQLAWFLDADLVEFDNPDYVAYARACGMGGFGIDRIGNSRRRRRAPPRRRRPYVVLTIRSGSPCPGFWPAPGRRARRCSSASRSRRRLERKYDDGRPAHRGNPRHAAEDEQRNKSGRPDDGGAAQITRRQGRNRRQPRPRSIAAFEGATFSFDELPEIHEMACAQPGARYPALSASPTPPRNSRSQRTRRRTFAGSAVIRIMNDQERRPAGTHSVSHARRTPVRRFRPCARRHPAGRRSAS